MTFNQPITMTDGSVWEFFAAGGDFMKVSITPSGGSPIGLALNQKDSDKLTTILKLLNDAQRFAAINLSQK